MSKIVLDVDGCAADFHGHVIDILSLPMKPTDFKTREITDQLDEKQRKLYYELMATPEFWGTLPLLDKDAPEIIRQARKSGHRIRWATSPWYGCKEWGAMRYQWLGDHFDVKPDDVHIGASKEDIAGDIFIDDTVDHVENWQREHPDGLAYVFKAPYNVKGGKAFKRIDWKDITKMLGVLL